MKHILSLLISLVLGFSIFAQEGSGSSMAIQPQNIFPTSPEAASLGKYGEIPVNLSTGRINHSIPIHVINEGAFSMPISLSYNYSGLQVEEIPGAVGLGWDFSGKGMITRQVRGLPDESQFGYIGPNQIGRKVYQYYTDPSSMTVDESGDLIKESASGRWDTESDKYIVSVGSLSATFYFNHEGQAIFAPYKNYKLTRLPNNGGFELIDDHGIKYVFIDKETAQKEVISAPSPISLYTSAWVINRIELPSNKQITFEYVNYHVGQRTYSDSWAKYDLFSPDYSLCDNYRNMDGVFKTITFNETFGLMASKITTPSEIIDFDYTIADPLNVTFGQNPVTLDSITIHNRVGQEIMNYGFQYNDESAKKKVLTAIHRGKTNQEQQKDFYRFEYYGNIPSDIAYYKQDYWGYYNGNKNTTQSLIPKNSNRAPDFNSTLSGALKKIHYPTKGYSELVYEQNQVYGKLDTGEIGNEDRLDVPISITISSDTYPITETINEVITIPFTPQALPGEQGVKVGLQYYLHSSLGYSLAWMELKRVGDPPSGCNDPTKICSKTDFASAELSPVTKTFDMTILTLEPGDYELKVQLERVPAISNPSMTPRAVANVLLKYYSGNTDPEPEDANISFGGIRIKQVNSCTEPGNCIKKQYSYVDENEVISTGINLSKPQYITTESHHYPQKTAPPGIPKMDCYLTRVLSSSQLPLSTYIGSPVLYKSVEEQTIGKANEMIRSRYYFSGETDVTEHFPYASTQKKNWRKGLTLEKHSFKKNENSYTTTAKTVNTYDQINGNTGAQVHLNSYNLKVGKIKYDYVYISGGNDTEPQVAEVDYVNNPSLFIEKRYANNAEQYQMISSKQEEIHNGKTIAKDIGYAYDFPYGQLKTQTTTDSKNYSYTTNYEYPYNSTTTINNKLVSQNRITNPIEVKEQENNTLLSTQITEFVDWRNNIILPGITKMAKGNDTPEARLTYHKYDTFGNPLEVSQAKGSRIIYIWGYNNTEPIAKIDNASYTEIPADVTALINQLKTISDTEDSDVEEDNMRTLFGNLRSHLYFKDSQITAYTYDPIIGVTSITSPKGETVYYAYDDFNRMQYVLDKDKHIVQQVRYNYEEQQSNAIGQVTINPSVTGTVAPDQQVSFTAATTGSNTNMLYTWSVNGVQEQCNTTTSFSKTFTSEGNYAVSVLVYDPQTKQSTSKVINVTVGYPILNTPTISKSHTYVVQGTNVTYTASGISGGSGSYRYEWYVNDVKQPTVTSTSFQYSSPSIGTYDVYFKLIDASTEVSTSSSVHTLHVYTAINTPSLSSDKYNFVKGATATFTTGNIGGGSGSIRFEWYINDIKQAYTGNKLIKDFDATGVYVVKFRVIDNTIPGYYKEKSVTVNSHNWLNTPSLAKSNTYFISGGTITFTGGNIGNGSGNRRYEWYINDIKQSYTGTKLVQEFTTAGTYTVKFRVVDTTIPDHATEKSVFVIAYDPLGTPSISANKTHIVKDTEVTFTASGISNGSGYYRYEWYVNNIKQSYTGTVYKNRFPTTGTYTVKFRVIDTRISPTHYKESNIKTVYSYNALSTPSIAKNHTYVLNGTTITFTGGNIANGSGSRRYEWYVNNVKQNYTGTQFSYTPSTPGTYTVRFHVVDINIPEHYRFQSATVYAYNPLNKPSISNTINRVHIVRGTNVTFTASGISGGSEYRRYEWYVNNVKQSATGTSFSYRYNTKGSYKVKFRVIDTRITPATHYKDSDQMTIYSYDPMAINITPGNANLSNTNPSVTFRINSVTGGSGSYTRGEWKLWKMTNPSWTRNVGSGSSFTAGMSENGEYELSVTYTDGLTKEIVLKTMPIIVNKSSGGGDGDCPDCGDQF